MGMLDQFVAGAGGTVGPQRYLVLTLLLVSPMWLHGSFSQAALSFKLFQNIRPGQG